MSTWSKKRQALYLVSFLAFWVGIGLAVYFILKPAPSCFDGKLNQTEEGVDCGGPCAQACYSTISPLKVLWARPILLATSTYDVASLVENTNRDAGLREVDYTIRLYDERGALIVNQSGSTFVNATDIFPIFYSGINTGSRLAKTATISFSGSRWVKAQPVSLPISIERIVDDNSLASSSKPKLHLQVRNLSLQNLKDVYIYAYLFDEEQNIFAASASLVDRLDRGKLKDVYLTWPHSLPMEPTSIKTYWRLDGFQLSSVK